MPGFDAAALASRLAALIPGWPQARLAIAVSGGADSAALLHAAAALAGTVPAARGAASARDSAPAGASTAAAPSASASTSMRVRALHVDHGLQPAARELERAADELASRCAVPFTVLRPSIPVPAGASLEAVARDARYAALAAELAADEWLLTAHHAEDQAETLLLQLLRGAGLPGLAAMPPVAPLGRARLARPLLDVARTALLDYARAHALPWHEDPMNADLRYDRAWLRHAVWPPVVERWPAAAATLSRSARHLAAAQTIVEEGAAADLARAARGAGLGVEALLAIPEPRRTALVRHWLAVAGLRSPPAHRLALVERELLRARTGTGPCLRWADGELHRYGDALYAFPPLPALPCGASLWPAQPLPLGALGELRLAPATGTGLSAVRTRVPLAVRARSGGERLELADGPAHRRALKDVLRESRVPPWTRERLVVLWDAGRVAAVVAPDRAWLAREFAAQPGEPAWVVEWHGAPAALRAAV